MSGTQGQKTPEQVAAEAKAKADAEAAKLAEGNGTGSQDDGDEGEDDSIYSDPKKAAELVKSLRNENAKHRTKNKELGSKLAAMEGTLGKLKKAFGGEEDDESDPAEKVAELSTANERLTMELHLRDIARESGVPAEREKYFRFLLAEKLEGLEEGQELGEEDIAEAVKAATDGFAPKKTSTGVKPGAGDTPNPDSTSGEVSVDQFAKMNLGEKSALYIKNPDLYNKLFAAAASKRML